MALVKCPECGTEISDKAVACPMCSIPKPLDVSILESETATDSVIVDSCTGKGNFPVLLVAFLLGMFAVMAHYGGPEPLPQPAFPISPPKQKEKNSWLDYPSVAQGAISNCWDEQKRKSLELNSQRLIASFCENMERDFIKKYGVEH
jgi:hypothetical protein